MKIDVVSDIHVGNHRVFGGGYLRGLNVRCRAVLDTLDRVYEESTADKIVIAGDVFHSDHPSPQMLAAVQAIVKKKPTLILVGNHDARTSALGDHALAPLAPVATVVDQPTVVDGLIMVPFRTGDPSVWLPQVLEDLDRQDASTLILHLGIADETTASFLRESTGCLAINRLVDICKAYGIRRVLSGDWHQRKSWNIRDVEVLQIGALVPTGFDNPGLSGYGTVVDVSKDSLSWREVPGFRFVRGQEFKLADVKTALSAGHSLHYKVVCDPDLVDSTTEALESAKSMGSLRAYKVVPKLEDALSRAVRASDAARNESTFDEQLVAYAVALHDNESFAHIVARKAKEYYEL